MSKPDTKRDWVDPDDAPELTKEWFDGAELKVAGVAVKRGRPRGSNKRQIAIRLDQDVIEHFKSKGEGWQTRLNAALRDWIAGH